MTFAKWTRPHFADDAETWSESELAPTLNGWEERHEVPPVLVAEPMAVSENQRAETRLTDYARQITSGGGKPGQGYPAVLTSCSEGSPARMSAWPASGPDYPASAAVSGLNSDGSCPNCGQTGWSSKMFPASLAHIAAETSQRSSWAWKSSGMGGPTEYWTRDGSESPSVAVACSLSAVLEVQPVPRRYWLSAKAAAGILRRAAKRGKTLPTRLLQALEGLVTDTATRGTPRT
jgi:hypothetical protein